MPFTPTPIEKRETGAHSKQRPLPRERFKVSDDVVILDYVQGRAREIATEIKNSAYWLRATDSALLAMFSVEEAAFQEIVIKRGGAYWTEARLKRHLVMIAALGLSPMARAQMAANVEKAYVLEESLIGQGRVARGINGRDKRVRLTLDAVMEQEDENFFEEHGKKLNGRTNGDAHN